MSYSKNVPSYPETPEAKAIRLADEAKKVAAAKEAVRVEEAKLEAIRKDQEPAFVSKRNVTPNLTTPFTLSNPVQPHKVKHSGYPNDEAEQKAVEDIKSKKDREQADAIKVSGQSMQDVLDKAQGSGHPITSAVDQEMVDNSTAKIPVKK